jgi:hypothetical protein
MSKYRKIIEQAIEKHKGEMPAIGSVVAHESDPISYELLRYENNAAVVGLDGEEKIFPSEEIFDVNAVKRTALNIKFQNQFKACVSAAKAGIVQPN